MQRWKLFAIIAVVVMGSALAAGGYAFWNARQNKPTRVWVPLEINPSLTLEQRQEAAGQIKNHLMRPEILTPVARDSGVAGALDFDSDELAAAHLRKRLFVEAGEFESPKGVVPSLNIGFDCTRREFKTMGRATTRMMKDVWAFIVPPESSQATDSEIH